MVLVFFSKAIIANHTVVVPGSMPKIIDIIFLLCFNYFILTTFNMKQENIIETDILTKIQNSDKIDANERNSLLHLIMYFTPTEIEELKLII